MATVRSRQVIWRLEARLQQLCFDAMAALPKIKLKAEIPESLKAETATTKWGKVLSVTPVAMTVIATMLAGLSSSEMTRAQYERSLAAQRQSKAGDQWSFFQAKRLRSTVLRSTLDGIIISSGLRPLDVANLPAPGVADAAAVQAATAALRDATVPKAAAVVFPAAVKTALTALEEAKPEAEILALIVPIASEVLDQALRDAQANALAFDAQLKPVSQVIEAWEKKLAAADPALRRDFVAARMNYNAQRYDAEARANQTVASVYEVQVRSSNLAAERHHRRSGRFFYGMLAAQLAVIVSTFAMAAQKRNLLWSIAAAAGLVAVSFTVYVLVFV